MPPRINNEGVYTATNTVDHNGVTLPYTDEEIARTRAYEAEHGIPSTLPDEDDVPDEAAV